ncbi:MAG: hypothetical protein K6F86_00625 [Lachnospiraceae bacterium]|nr:hypothetical protein [Lachnospiraceae bacterium]
MKKAVSLLVCVIVIILEAGCGKSENEAGGFTTGSQNNVQSVLEQGMSESEDLTGTESDYIDLTEFSSTMVYSEVYNMMYYPENYIGKMVKMSGVYAVYHDESTGKDYHACIISDATACCSQGIEFELTDDYSYPDDYPEEGGQICVEGVFDTYREGENIYCTLRDSKIRNT